LTKKAINSNIIIVVQIKVLNAKRRRQMKKVVIALSFILSLLFFSCGIENISKLSKIPEYESTIKSLNTQVSSLKDENNKLNKEILALKKADQSSSKTSSNASSKSGDKKDILLDRIVGKDAKNSQADKLKVKSLASLPSKLAAKKSKDGDSSKIPLKRP
jgi:cell division protein FtsB